jgi:hypothetical protein
LANSGPYILGFGAGNAGLSPYFVVFQDAATFAAIPAPTIVENPSRNGLYYFLFDWTTVPTTKAISYVTSTLNGVTLWDTIQAPTLGAVTPLTVVTGPGTTKLGDVRTACKERVGMESSTFITDAEWNSYINASVQELYGMLIQAFGNDYYTATPYQITTDGTNERYALPTDFFKLLGVDLKWPGAPSGWVTLKPFAFQERNAAQYGSGSATPASGQVIQIHYAPRIGALANDSDTLDGVNGWEEYVITDCCIKALAKEESDVSVFLAQKAALVARIQAEAENRDAGMPATVVDIHSQNFLPTLKYRLNGSNLWLRQLGPVGVPFGGMYGWS